jgi:hypothetical protein
LLCDLLQVFEIIEVFPIKKLAIAPTNVTRFVPICQIPLAICCEAFSERRAASGQHKRENWSQRNRRNAARSIPHVG